MMHQSINKVILMGYLGSAPELRITIHGTYVTNVSLVTSTHGKIKQSGEVKTHNEWHKLVFYNKLAEVVGEYLNKGDIIYIEGHLRTRQWQGQADSSHSITEIIANEMQLLSNKPLTKNTHHASWYGKHQTGAKRPDLSWLD